MRRFKLWPMRHVRTVESQKGVDEQLDPLLFCDGCNRVYCLACIRHLDETNPVLECLELALQCPCCSGNHCYEGAFSS